MNTWGTLGLSGVPLKDGCARHGSPTRAQVHDEVILEGPAESAERAQELVVAHMERPFSGTNPLLVDLVVDSNIAGTWYEAK